MIRNIIFDMGNVIIRFRPDIFAARLGLGAEDTELLIRSVFRSPEWPLLDNGTLTEEQALPRMLERIPARLHRKAEELLMNWEEPVLEIPGMYELIRGLKREGYGIYLLTNASSRQHVYWQRVPAAEFFDGTVVSADEKLAKPDPALFRTLLERFGLRADGCLFVDDSAENVQTAETLGMRGYLFREDPEELRAFIMKNGKTEEMP